MANEEQLSILKQGVQVWNKWRGEHYQDLIDLSNSNLQGAELDGANFYKADLSNANLDGGNFRKANLSEANLKNANLNEAHLWQANLKDANLTEASFYRADLMEVYLRGAQLIGTKLERAKINGATIGETTFVNLDLSEIIGLNELMHIFPSYIGVDTLQLSKGRTPNKFLRGCGLSDVHIEYSKLLDPNLSDEQVNEIIDKLHALRASQAIQIPHLFLSYTHEDYKFVDKLEDYLNKAGLRYWRDIHRMIAGRMEKQIDRAISQHRAMLIILSKNSLNSDWVEYEVRRAHELEKEMGRDMLCPIALDDSWKSSKWEKRLMEQIMKYNILDFSEWQDDVKFEGMFRKLIDGLELFYKG